MAYLDCDERFATGIPSIDYEHRRLVDLVNNLDLLITDGASAQSIAATLAEFHALATAHFALEERIMQALRHSRYKYCRDEHYRLLDEVRDIMEGYERGVFEPLARLPAALKDWLCGLMNIDAEMFAGLDEATLKTWHLSRTRH